MLEGPPAEVFSQISATQDFTCGITDQGRARCWGTTSSEAAQPIDVPIPQLGVGRRHACRVGTDDAIECWTSEPQPGVPPSGSFRQVDSGDGFSVALDQDFVAESFGTLGGGPLGADFATQVAAGGAHACQLVPDPTPPGPSSTASAKASVECWGDDSFGQATVATDPAGGPLNFQQISAGDVHTCGIIAGGSIECWGGGSAALSQGVADPTNGRRFLQVSAGALHNCGLRANGTLHCWGDDTYGQATPPGGRFEQVAAAALCFPPRERAPPRALDRNACGL